MSQVRSRRSSSNVAPETAAEDYNSSESTIDVESHAKTLERHDSEMSVGYYGQIRRVESTQLGRHVKKVVVEDEEGEHDVDSEHLMSWQTTGMVLIGDVVGMGVLTMGIAFAQLGWVIALFFVIIMCPINIYIGMLLAECRFLIPAGYTYQDMAKFAIGKRVFTVVVQFTFYSYVFLALGGYMLAISESISMIFYNTPLCTPLWALVSIGLLIVPCQVQTLTEATYLVWLNFFCIIMAVFMSLIYMVSHMDSIAVTFAFAENLGWVSFFNGISKITFSYLGCYIYLEIMTEMKQPSEFPKAFSIAGPFQLGMYLLVGTVVYLTDGANAVSKEMILWDISLDTDSITFVIASVFLLLHLIVAYLIKSTILTRAIVVGLLPSKYKNASGFRMRMSWFCVSGFILVVAFIVSNAVPIFSKLTSLMGALNAPLLGYVFPICFTIGARRSAKVVTGYFEGALLIGIVSFAIILLIAGTSANIISLLENLKTFNQTPFQCVHEPFRIEWEKSNYNVSS